MNAIQAIIMGLVQGLTEFLPVSSSAHLVFADHFLHLRLSEADTVSFDVLLHLGTLIAVLVYFRTDILHLLTAAGHLLRRPRQAWATNPFSRLFVLLVLGTVPAAIIGVAFKDFFSEAFQSVPMTAMLLFVTAAMLIWITRRQTGERTLEGATWKDALTIGAFQAFAILPGVSRSGSTITGGLLRGLDREAAPRFSFLLSIPIILAGGLFDLKDTLETGLALPPLMLALGFIAAAVSGYAAIVLLLGMIRCGRLDRFAYYCLTVGILVLGYWIWLVPKVAPETLVGVVDGEVRTVAKGELSPVELGQQLQLRLKVEDGIVPVEEVYALLPAAGHPQPEVTRFVRPGGKNLFESEKYTIRPIGTHYTPSAKGETREVWVVVRNKWGIQNETRVRIRVFPESLLRRTARNEAQDGPRRPGWPSREHG